MKIRDVMSSNPKCTHPEATLQQAAEVMRQMDVGSLPVCEDDCMVGVITDRDISVRSVSEGSDPTKSHVRDVMTHGVIYCYEDQEAEEAAQLMRDHQIRRLPVLNRDKRLIGMVSLGDLACETGNDELAGRTLEGISEAPGL